MIYAGYSKRFFSWAVDALFLIPTEILYRKWFVSSPQGAVESLIVIGTLQFAFHIIFLSLYGQTPGKMLLKIKIVRCNGEAIILRDTLLRLSVNLFLSIGFGAALIFMLLRIPAETFQSTLWFKQFDFLGRNPALTILTFSNTVQAVWNLLDNGTLLFTKQIRAIHDFIADTVVIDTR